jgi:GNAT superfamily N-acetyltransferase
MYASKEFCQRFHFAICSRSMDEMLTFSVTPYHGYEDEARTLLNRNRECTATREYLDWRYLGEKSSREPMIVWIYSNDGTLLGMNGFIFRFYWVNNRKCTFAVSGDMSIDSEFRGRGLGKILARHMTSYLEQGGQSCGFVIPNPIAQRCLSSQGWKVEERLVPHVFLLDIRFRLHQRGIENPIVTKVLAKLAWWYAAARLTGISTEGFSCAEVEEFDGSFDTLWDRVMKEGFVLRDRSAQTLRWRYYDHPHEKFRICKMMERNDFVGYAVYSISGEGAVCVVYDFLVVEERQVKPAMASFIRELNRGKSTDSIRVILNENHPYSRIFKSMGFLKRKTEGVLLTYAPEGSQLPKSVRWFITLGDKDV